MMRWTINVVVGRNRYRHAEPPQIHVEIMLVCFIGYNFAKINPGQIGGDTYASKLETLDDFYFSADRGLCFTTLPEVNN